MIQTQKAPVVMYDVYVAGAATTPALIWDGTGSASMFIQSSTGYGDAPVGVVFGPNASMPVASIANAFPVPFEGIVWKIGPATRYISVCILDAAVDGQVVYYFEGQTDLTT